MVKGSRRWFSNGPDQNQPFSAIQILTGLILVSPLYKKSGHVKSGNNRKTDVPWSDSQCRKLGISRVSSSNPGAHSFKDISSAGSRSWKTTFLVFWKPCLWKFSDEFVCCESLLQTIFSTQIAIRIFSSVYRGRKKMKINPVEQFCDPQHVWKPLCPVEKQMISL